MFHIHSAGSLISREASTVLVGKNHRSHSECTGGVLTGERRLFFVIAFLLYQLTFTVLMHTVPSQYFVVIFFILVAVGIHTCVCYLYPMHALHDR